jgi:glyoxylase-like metal-dependent hydrolase (beta-lactamase superfamily II)
MSVELYAFTCGYLTLPYSFLLQGRDGTLTVPVPSYLIVHPKGRVIFDSGLHEATMDDPIAHLSAPLARFFTVHFHRGEEIAARLEAIGVAPDRVELVVNSHLHYDHCGGNAQLPNADVIVQDREVIHAKTVDARSGYLRNEWDTGQKLRVVDGEHDVFGDGSVVCIPTYGHTPGHQSLRVRTEKGGEFMLCGDACYLKESLDKLHTPGVVADRDAMVAVFHRFREMRDAGVNVMYGHDPEFWKTVPQAPVRLG